MAATAAAAIDQPLKKRKLEGDPSPQNLLTQDEILRRLRNRGEIRGLYESYKRIRYCVLRKDPRLMSEFEQAYLALITASRGCTSVQRIVAELIPRYASFCPTALEAAMQVSINMHNWSLSIIMRGEDVDGVAYHTVKACIFGLIDICGTASHEAPTSSVISGICSSVFQSALTFFTSSFDGKDIYQIGQGELLKLQEPMEVFSDLKQEPADNSDPPLHKLFKFRILSLLRIFFSFPKELLDACFELFVSNGTDVQRKGARYFLNQLTILLNADDGTLSSRRSDGVSLCIDSAQHDTGPKGAEETNLPYDNNHSENTPLLSKNCFIGMALEKETSLRDWMIWRYKKLCKSFSSEDIFVISSFLENIFGSLSDLINDSGSEETNEDQYSSSPHVVHKNTLPHNDNVDAPTKAHSLGVSTENTAETDVAENVKSHQSFLSHKVDTQGNEGERSISIRHVNMRCLEDSCPNKFPPKAMTNGGFIPPINSMGSHAIGIDKIQGSNIGSASNIFPSPRQHSTAKHFTSYNQLFWYSEEDPEAMDVFSASNQLWVNCLGHDVSEELFRLAFEDFGPLEKFIFVPAEDFTLIEYRNLMDAVRAREYMCGSSPWGSCLCIKFIDKGLGNTGTDSNIAVGDRCHVYVAKVVTQWAKDEIMNELMILGVRPRMVTDLSSESALLLEFWNAEEATAAMRHIRHHRKEVGRHAYPTGSLTASTDSNKFSKDTRRIETGIAANSMVFSPSASSVHDYSVAMNTKTSAYFPPHRDVYSTRLEIGTPNSYYSSFTYKSEGSIHELVSPRVKMEDVPTQLQSVHAFQSNWSAASSTEMLEVGSRNVNDFGRGTPMHYSFAAPVTPAHGGSMIPPPIQGSSYVHPVYFNSSNCWDSSSHNPSTSDQYPTCMKSMDNRHINALPIYPFLPSVTPISQLGGSMQRSEQMVTVPSLSSLVPQPPPDAPPHVRYSPAPLPLSQPPSVPPPPSSAPPQHAPEPSILKEEACVQYRWQGTLTKSGIHYCTIFATREESPACSYSSAFAEPLGWPDKLNVTKRTDLRHVKITFTKTRHNRKEVCRLRPSTSRDHNGFNDFVSYLKQRECAGVIKVPAGNSIWARLLFILPCTLDICTFLGISPQPADCLLAVVLPKDTSSEG